MSAFGKSSERPGSGIDTLVGTGVRVDGDIVCDGTLCVQGCVDGNISCDGRPGATLIVDNTGTVTGSVCAARMVVRGRIDGSVDSSESVELQESARVIGDISFRALAVDSGAVIEGRLIPKAVVPVAVGGDGAAAVPAAPSRAGPGFRLQVPHLLGLAAALIVSVAVAYYWQGRQLSPEAPPEPAAQARAELRPAEPVARKPSSSPVAVPAGTPAPEAEKAAPPPAAEAAKPDVEAVSRSDGENIVNIRGANPSRPSGVFLLVSSEPAVLFRKKRGEAGEGARIPVNQGKVSVSVAPDDLIRIAKGRDITLYYQGQKVSREQIDGDAWISFVPR